MPTPATPSLILASGSPRRRELLAHLVEDFEVMTSQADENSPETDPAALATALAQRKAEAVAKTYAAYPKAAGGRAVLGADTVVALGGALLGQPSILGKPSNEAENRQFIRQLSSRTHHVVTGLCLLASGKAYTAFEKTAVTFRRLSPSEIAHYAASGEGLDKAGGYGIQGLGMALVERLEGDYSNVVGLPLARTLELLRAGGVPVRWK